MERTLNALLVGTDSSRGDLRPVLLRAGFTLKEQPDLPASRDAFDLVCIALDHPDQFAAEDVRRFLAAFSGGRILCVRSAWCASMLRSRSDWPVSIVVEAAAFEGRLEIEKQVLLGKRAPLPITAGLEEVAAFQRSANILAQLMIAVVVSAGLAVSGCGGSKESNTSSPPGPTWAEQVQSVRGGAGKKISGAASSKADWEQLKSGCSALEVLEVEGDLPPHADISVLMELPHLRRLKLDRGLDDAQAAVLSQHPSLSELVISSETLTDEGLKSLCRLPLVQLRLRAPKITDAAMGDVGQLKQLRFLHLIDIPLTDTALTDLAKLESLESLYLDRTKCTDDGLSTLLKQRPDIHFHRDQTHLRDDPRKHEH